MNAVVSAFRTFHPKRLDGLDLACIHEDQKHKFVIMAMCSPVRKGWKSFIGLRNNVDDVARFFETHFPNRYRVYNLTEDAPYDFNTSFKSGTYTHIPIPDHHVPLFDQLLRFCTDVENYTVLDASRSAAARTTRGASKSVDMGDTKTKISSKDEEGGGTPKMGGLSEWKCIEDDIEWKCIAVHCKAGKGRTGTLICCLLQYMNICANADEALKQFAVRRSEMKNNKHRGVDQPSQVRWVRLFELLLRQTYLERQHKRHMLRVLSNFISKYEITLTRVRVHAVPDLTRMNFTMKEFNLILRRWLLKREYKVQARRRKLRLNVTNSRTLLDSPRVEGRLAVEFRLHQKIEEEVKVEFHDSSADSQHPVAHMWIHPFSVIKMGVVDELAHSPNGDETRFMQLVFKKHEIDTIWGNSNASSEFTLEMSFQVRQVKVDDGDDMDSSHIEVHESDPVDLPAAASTDSPSGSPNPASVQED